MLKDCLSWLEKQGGLKLLWDPNVNKLTVLRLFLR